MLSQKTNRKIDTKYAVGILYFVCLSSVANELTASGISAPLSFATAITSAQKNDPWLMGNIHKQRSIEAMSLAVSTLPDPKVSLGLANLPTNGFDFGQEGMTQAKIGLSQMFPRGDTLDIKSQQLKIKSAAYSYQRQDRAAKITVTVGSLWLDAYRVQQSIALIEKNRSLFEQLADVAQASYSSTFGKTRQQDIVRAQLELTRLEDRLDKLAQQKNRYEGMLFQWLTELSTENSSEQGTWSATDYSLYGIVLSQQLPQIELLNPDLIFKPNWLSPEKLIRYFSNHPAVVATDKKIHATTKGIALAKQKYKPEWGVSASYGYRDDDPMGNSRADLFSVGVTFDLPLFTENRQDQEVQSAISTTEAVKTEKLLLIRQLQGAYASGKGRLLRLKKRQHLYKTKLLPQIHDQAEASLTAYTNDDGDFAEVVRSRISVLNAEIDQLTLNVEEQKILLELNYLFIGQNQTAIANDNIAEKTKNYTYSTQIAAIAGEK